MPRQANAVDFWRGFALVSIFINHVPGITYERLTHRNFSISDSAELFVFLAGWSLGLLVTSRGQPMTTPRIVLRLGGRTAYLTDNRLVLEWHNAAAVFREPETAHIGLVLLTHQLGYFDILPLYVVLMLAAPGIAVIDRYAKPAMVPLSLALYFASLSVPFTARTWPIPGQWFFNPFTWQAIFVLGFALSRNEGLGALARRHLKWVQIVSLPIVLLAAVVVIFNLFPDPTKVPEPKLLFINGKTFLTPMRLIQFLALAAVFSGVFPYIARPLPWLAELLSKLGRNSLNVFCVGSVLSLMGQILRYLYGGSFAGDTLVVAAGIALLWLTAWVSEWREKQTAAAT
jgi:hypothetical protein